MRGGTTKCIQIRSGKVFGFESGCSTNKKTLESKDLRVFFCVLKMILVFYHRIVIGPLLEKQ